MKSTRYMVMSAFLWSSIEPPVSMDPGGPQRFIPVFDTKEQALAWLDGDESEIRELITEKA